MQPVLRGNRALQLLGTAFRCWILDQEIPKVAARQLQKVDGEALRIAGNAADYEDLGNLAVVAADAAGFVVGAGQTAGIAAAAAAAAVCVAAVAAAAAVAASAADVRYSAAPFGLTDNAIEGKKAGSSFAAAALHGAKNFASEAQKRKETAIAVEVARTRLLGSNIPRTYNQIPVWTSH